jgi:hypothetical protein
LPVATGCCVERSAVGGVDGFGESGRQEPVVDSGEEDRCGQAGVGDVVAVGVRDTVDQAVQA